jgi:glyoxylase-like metal-dependent hydrolase (beta-lactamase superfamily II)
MFLFDYPKGFNPDNYKIPSYRVNLIKDGHVFDLGNRSLEVVHTPGHSGDSIMLFDNENKILFTGDTFYLGALYAHFDCREFGKSNIEDYLNSMGHLLEKYPDVRALYCSHNDFIAEPSKLSETLSALESIMVSKIEAAVETKAAHSYLEDRSKLMEYNFNGFSIIVKS